MCRCSDYVVLLDLKRDQFFGLSKKDAGALAQCVPGIPAFPADSGETHSASQPQNETLRALLSEFSGEGMLVAAGESDEQSKPIRRANIQLREPSQALIEGYERPHNVVTPVDIAYFVSAVCKVHSRYFRGDVLRLVRQVADRHAEISSAANESGSVRRLVAVFRNLAPFLFTSKDKCLIESLVLCEFLAHRAIFPYLVIGVSTAPFRAHCWLQLDDVVLNDTPEFVTQFTPILIV